jgi:hypothetical protein
MQTDQIPGSARRWRVELGRWPNWFSFKDAITNWDRMGLYRQESKF